MGKKQLYESIQALEARISSQNKFIDGLTSGLINPSVANSYSYNQVLASADMIQACNRYITDIPELELPSNRLEALFYLYGSLCFFKERDRVWVGKYAKEGNLNKLGDLSIVSPIDLAGVKYRQHRQVVYSNKLEAYPCVIINDYTGTYTESNIIPRCSLNTVSITDQAAVYRQLKNSVKLTAKKAVAIIENESQRDAVSQSIDNILNNDSPVLAIACKNITDVFKLHNIDTKLDIEGYLRAIEAYERIRANFNGIHTRSMLDKKERLIQSEAQNDNTLTDIYLYDGLINRQIGIELMKKHSIIKEGSCVINPILNKNKNDSTKMEKKGENEQSD